MPAQIISGTEIAKQIREELKEEIAGLKEQHNLVPGLATVLVGEDPASQVYVGQKEKTSKVLGLYSKRYDLPADTSEEELLALVSKLNKSPKIHGILVQLPLPKHINETKVLYAIDPKKDVDGFHPVNLGKLMIGEPDYLPCTPHGIQQLLVRSATDAAPDRKPRPECDRGHRKSRQPPAGPGPRAHFSWAARRRRRAV